jgi:signal transduction histidine kinase
MKINNFLLIFILCFWSQTTTAETTNPPEIEITNQFSQRKIGREITFLEDPSRQLTFDQIREPEFANRFVRSTKDSPNFGYTQSTYWVSFNLSNTRPANDAVEHNPLYLTLGYAQTDYARLWCTNSSNIVVLDQKAGDHVLRADWPDSYREPTFVLSNNAKNCWLQVKSSASMQFPLTLYSEKKFFQIRNQDNAVQALYFGALIVMLIYNGLISISTRSSAYANYTFFLLCYGLFQCAFGGFGYALLWQDAIGWADVLAPFFISCIGISSLLFTSNILDLRKTSRRWFWLCQGLAFLFGCSLLLPWVLSYSMAIRSVFMLTPFWAIILFGSGITLALRGVRVAKIYLFAWSVFIGGSLISISTLLGLLPTNIITSNAPQIGSAIEFILLSFALADRIKTTQAALLQAQKEVTDNLRVSEQLLNEKVELRTAELKSANVQTTMTLRLAETARERAVAAQRQAEQERKEAELARVQTAQALSELQSTQSQLIAAEKMASLGLLVSNVAHEINTPIGAVKSSGALISDTLRPTLAEFPKLFKYLDDESVQLLMEMVLTNYTPAQPLSAREERALTKQVAAQLDLANIEDSQRKARLVMKLRVHQHLQKYLPLLQHSESDFILDIAGNIADVINSTDNINFAVERVSRVVYALKALSGDDVAHAVTCEPLPAAMDKALAKFQNQMHNVELITDYQTDMPAIHADHDAVTQLCIHLIMNGLQAMNYVGTLTVGLAAANQRAIFTVTDTGTGIPDGIKDRIFEPFFTTRTSGEGSGMGLAIVKRIVEQHQGQMELQTEVGIGTTFTISLPYEKTTT